MESHPWSTPVDKFIGLAVASGLVSVDDLISAMDAIRTDPSSASAPELNRVAEYFITHGLLTRWQCGKLLDGRYKGFFLDQYKFLEMVGIQGDYANYLVEDCTKHERAVLALRRNDAKPHGIEYHVLVDPASQ